MNTSTVLIAILGLLRGYPYSSEVEFDRLENRIQDLAIRKPEYFAAAIRCIEREMRWAQVNEHIAADEERT